MRCDVEGSFLGVILTAKKLAGHFDEKRPLERVMLSKIHPALESVDKVVKSEWFI